MADEGAVEAAPIPPATERFAEQVGPDARARPQARPARALGAFAALVAVPALGALIGEIVTGDRSKGVGFVAFALYGAGGVLVVMRGGPSRRSAGVVALAASIPIALGFVIFSDDGFSTSEPTTVLALSTVAWAVLHLAGPARGHAVLLAAALTGAWATIVLQTGIDAVAALSPTALFSPGFGPTPETATPALVSLVFGAGYLVGAFALDRSGLGGTATAFLGVGIAATSLGVVLAGVGRDPAVVGGLLLTAGLLLAFIGAVLTRRLSTWLGAAAATIGAALLLARPFEDSAEGAAIAVLAGVGVVVVLLPTLDSALGGGKAGGGPGATPPPAAPQADKSPGAPKPPKS